MQGLRNESGLGAPCHCLFEGSEDFHLFLTGSAGRQVALEGTLFLGAQLAIEVRA
jgi:hypothetical protein